MGHVKALHGRRILVIEDDFLIAEVVSEMLADAGADVVGPIGRIDEALAFVERNSATFDAAVLDVNLHGRTSYPVADALLALNIKFVFTTGYDVEALEEKYQACPRCQKPYQEQTLVAALAPIFR